MNTNETEKPLESKKKIVVIAFLALLAFFIISKALSSISTNPAKISYEKRCASCHGEDGIGLKEMIPPLANSDWLRENQDRLACIIKYGMHEKIMVNNREYDIEMLGATKIQDIEITNIINYMNTSWGNNITTKKNKDVVEELKACE